MRLDAALVSRGLVGGRDKAKRLVADGQITVNGAVVTKASAEVQDTDELICAVTERFVGRGGEKLLKVIEEMPLKVDGAVCVDVGASTGGFTDCLLQYGASQVYAVDVGHDQLADKLRADPRVVCMEGTDIRRRDIAEQHIPYGDIDLCTVDVSFISLTQIWDHLMALIKPDGLIVCLVKPQFEAGRAALSKRGVVRKETDHIGVLRALLRFWQEKGCECRYLSWSPVRGGEGNIEYVAVLSSKLCENVPFDATAVVKGAFSAFRGESR